MLCIGKGEEGEGGGERGRREGGRERKKKKSALRGREGGWGRGVGGGG